MIQPTSLGWRRKRADRCYEEKQWPRRPPSVADLICHLMDQHSLTRADLIPLLGAPSRVSEVMRGSKGLSMAMVQRLRARSGCRQICFFRLRRKHRRDVPLSEPRPNQ